MAEETIIGEIGVMVEAARAAKKAAEKNNYKTAIQQLRVVNTQGRRLEWSGGKTGLKHLPELKEVEQIKKGISVARAAAQEALSAIEHLDSLPSKEEKKPAEAAAIRQKESAYKKTAGKNITMMESTLITTLEKTKKEPWMDLVILSRPENKDSLVNFLTRRGYYGYLSKEEIFAKRNKLVFRRIDLSGANFRGANFSRMDLSKTDLLGADLRDANLVETWLIGADLYKANLEGANLRGAVLIGANLSGVNLSKALLMEADFSDANLSGANLTDADLTFAKLYRTHLGNAILMGADLKSVRDLTKGQFRIARWHGAKNIPPSYDEFSLK